jgi:hypothetical protein
MIDGSIRSWVHCSTAYGILPDMPKPIKHKDPDAAVPPASKAFRAYMAILGKKGGRVSGARRLTNLTPKQRSAIAQKAARARWNAPKATPEKP